ncbi:MAG: cation transporter [Clostridia bacterium]|nr:cation transporter [Clostridia bacterium]
MIKITVTIEGMHCPKCAAKVKAAIEDKFSVKSVSVSHESATALIESEHMLDAEGIKAVVSAVGFTVTDVVSAESKKEGFFKRLFKKN